MNAMRKIEIYTVYRLCVIVCVILTSSCTNEETDRESFEGDLPEMKVHTRAISDNTAKATLMFWDDDTFHKKLVQGNSATPYGVVQMNQYIDFFRNESGETFSTGLTYGEGANDYLHATGYAPSEALSPVTANDGTLDYTRLNVEEMYQDGKTDFLCCDGNYAHRGSYSDPFTEEDHELKFRHLTSRIRFVGKRDAVMYGVISVNNVKVTLLQTDNQPWYIPTAFEPYYKTEGTRENDCFTYIVKEFKQPQSIELTPENNNYIPSGDNGMDLSACYVLHKYPEGYDPFEELVKKSGIIKLKLYISADFSWYNGGTPLFYQTFTWNNQEVEVSSDFGNTMYPGCEYVVYITFKHEGITLQGVQQSWEDGGIHYLPVVPDSN